MERDASTRLVSLSWVFSGDGASTRSGAVVSVRPGRLQSWAESVAGRAAAGLIRAPCGSDRAAAWRGHGRRQARQRVDRRAQRASARAQGGHLSDDGEGVLPGCPRDRLWTQRTHDGSQTCRTRRRASKTFDAGVCHGRHLPPAWTYLGQHSRKGAASCPEHRAAASCPEHRAHQPWGLLREGGQVTRSWMSNGVSRDVVHFTGHWPETRALPLPSTSSTVLWGAFVSAGPDALDWAGRFLSPGVSRSSIRARAGAAVRGGARAWAGVGARAKGVRSRLVRRALAS